jgi:uncharacterized protein (TIGR03083 family)
MDGKREPGLPGRLLAAERDVLIPWLRVVPEERFTTRTACPAWDVRQVLAHCSAALMRIVEGRLEPGVFSDESNARDVAERDGWSAARVLDELERGMTEAGPVIAAREDGLLDTVALGEWVHAGDARDALGEPGAYGGNGVGVEEALVLLGVASRRRRTPVVRVRLAGRAEPLVLGTGGDRAGDGGGGRPEAQLATDVETLVRLYTGRSAAAERYELVGAAPEELLIYR